MPSAADTFADEIYAHQLSIAKWERDRRLEARQLLTELEAELVAQIAKANPTSQARLKQLLSATRATIQTSYDALEATNERSMLAAGRTQGRLARKALSQAIGIPVASVGMTDEQLAALLKKPVVMGQPAAAWWHGQNLSLQNSFARQMQLGYASGETIDQLIRRVRGTKAAEYTDGIMSISKAQAEALVRTSINSISNHARLASFERMGDAADTLVWSSTFDQRTSNICKSLAGLKWNLKTKEPIDHKKSFLTPPAHFNCRSVLTLVPKAWADIEEQRSDLWKGQAFKDAFAAALARQGFTPEQIAKAEIDQRATMDGAAPADVTLEDWLRKKPQEWLVKSFGARPLELWQAGQITLQDLTDNFARPRSNEELAALSGVRERKRAERKELERKATEAARVEAELEEARRNEKLAATIAALETVVPKEALLDAAKAVQGSRSVDLEKLKRPKPGQLDVASIPNCSVTIRLEGPSEAKQKIKSLFKEWMGMTPEKYFGYIEQGIGEKLQQVTMSIVAGKGGKKSVYFNMRGKTWFADRLITGTEIDHSYFKVNGKQASGFGKKLLAAQLDLYDHAGIEKVTVHANIDVGGYAWARAGFKPDNPKRFLAMVEHRINDLVEWGKLSRQDANEIERIMADDEDGYALQRMAATPFGKVFLLGSNWWGTLDLTDEERYAYVKNYAGAGKESKREKEYIAPDPRVVPELTLREAWQKFARSAPTMSLQNIDEQFAALMAGRARDELAEIAGFRADRAELVRHLRRVLVTLANDRTRETAGFGDQRPETNVRIPIPPLSERVPAKKAAAKKPAAKRAPAKKAAAKKRAPAKKAATSRPPMGAAAKRWIAIRDDAPRDGAAITENKIIRLVRDLSLEGMREMFLQLGYPPSGSKAEMREFLRRIGTSLANDRIRESFQ